MDASKYRTPSIEELYSFYADMLYRLAYSHVLNKEDAEDIIAEVFLKVVKKKQNFNDQNHEKAWLIRVTINTCHDFIRRKKLRVFIQLDTIEDIPDEEQTSKDILEHVFQLDKKYKSCVLLYYFEDFSVSEISKTLLISESAVKMRLKRGREQLKMMIGREENV